MTLRKLLALGCFVGLPLGPAASVRSADQEKPAAAALQPAAAPCAVLADRRVEEPVRAIAGEYTRRTGAAVSLRFLPAAEVNELVQKGQTGSDVAVCMSEKKGPETAVSAVAGAARVAWKHPSGEPVWAAAISGNPEAAELVRFLGGPTGHRLWSESKAGFTITTGKTHAEAFDWVVQHRVKHTYPITAVRMLHECGDIREGTCIDIGCGTGALDVELAKRSKLKIIGLDIDPDMKPLFEKTIRDAGFQDRVSFVEGDAQKLPFEDDSADMIVSRGTLTFIPDIAKCLREVDRVLKPTGVAFLGGRYVYTPQAYKISNEKLKKIVADSGVAGARVIDERGQWVKILGPQAPQAARDWHGGPEMLAYRIVADYALTQGDCLVVCGGDGGLEQALQQGLADVTELRITALYPSEKVAAEAEKRIGQTKAAGRITCKVGKLEALPFEPSSFDLVAGVGPVLIWGDREKKMRELDRVLRPGGVALVGGKFLHMPDWRKVPSETLRQAAAKTGIPSIRVIDDMGQWVEVRKGTKDRGLRD